MRLVFVVAIAGCFSAHPAPGAPCADNGACPSGLVCSPATDTCELHAIDAGTRLDGTIDARRPLDAGIDAAVSPTLVQQTSNSARSAATISATLPSLPAAGDVLVMIGGNPQGALTSVTGGGVAAWTLAARATANANVEVWYGVSNGSSAVVTIMLTGSASSMSIVVAEWSRLATTNTLDVALGSSGIASPATSSITTTNAHDLVLFAAADLVPNTWGVPGPGAWTEMLGLDAAMSQLEWYRVETTVGTFAPMVTETANHWDAVVAAFRIAP